MKNIYFDKNSNFSSRNSRSIFLSKNFENINYSTGNGIPKNNHYLKLSRNHLSKKKVIKEKIYKLTKTQFPNSKIFTIAEPKSNLEKIKTTKLNGYKTRFHSILRSSSKEKNKNRKFSDDIMQLIKSFHEFNTSKYEAVNSYTPKYSESNILNNNLYKKFISHSMTKTFKITEKTDKNEVKKLSEWDKDNLLRICNDSNEIYNKLLIEYNKKNDKKKLAQLKNYKSIIDLDGDDMNKIFKSTSNKNNQIIKNFLNKKAKEQSRILQNSIAKTRSRFEDSLLFNKEKKISSDFGIDNNTIKSMRRLGEKNENIDIYKKIIKGKEKNEMQKTEEIMNLIIEIINKKKEARLLEKNINDSFEKTNKNNVKYKNTITKINKEIDDIRDLYNTLLETECTKDKKIIKLNELQNLKLKRNNLQIKLNETEKEIQTNNKELEITKKKLSEELNIVQNEISYLKIVYLTLVKAQRNYYFEILKKGYDSRSYGLVWVVRRLLELQTDLEYFQFPKFLDNQQINYLMEIANLSLEEMQLKIILKIIQKKRNDIENNVSKQIMNKMLEFSNNNYVKRKNVTTLYNEMRIIKKNAKSEKFSNEIFSNKIFSMFKKIYDKYESALPHHNMKNVEDIQTEQIINEIKCNLMEEGGSSSPEDFQQLTKVLDYLNRNKESREYLEFILKVKFRMSYISYKKNILKKEQMKLFKERTEMDSRFTNAESSLKYDLVFAALFGDKP